MAKKKAEKVKVRRHEKRRHTPKPGRPKPGAPYLEWAAYWKANPLVPLNTPSIMNAVIRELKQAGKDGRKITKPEILAVLAQEFPDRDPHKMETNLNNLLPTRLRCVYAIHVWRGMTESGYTGYYIPGDGKKPQSKADLAKAMKPLVELPPGSPPATPPEGGWPAAQIPPGTTT